jgi:hypothetical protein
VPYLNRVSKVRVKHVNQCLQFLQALFSSQGRWQLYQERQELAMQ